MERALSKPFFGRKDIFGEWDLFVLRHSTQAVIWWHLVSFVLFWFSPLLAIYYWNPYYLIGFLGSGLVGAFGHYITDSGPVNVKEATSSIQVVLFSSTMIFLFLCGRYQKEVEQANRKLDLYLKGNIESTFPRSDLRKIGVEE